jgi:hypothetical protein
VDVPKYSLVKFPVVGAANCYFRRICELLRLVYVTIIILIVVDCVSKFGEGLDTVSSVTCTALTPIPVVDVAVEQLSEWPVSFTGDHNWGHGSCIWCPVNRAIIIFIAMYDV